MLFKGKDNIHSRTGHEGPEGKQRYSSTLSLTSALDGGVCSTPCSGHFTLGNTRDSFYRMLGRSQGRSGRVRKILPPPGFNPRTVQPVASSYTGPQIMLFVVLKLKITVKRKHDGVLIEI